LEEVLLSGVIFYEIAKETNVMEGIVDVVHCISESRTITASA
jgi:hypothetical protein